MIIVIKRGSDRQKVDALVAFIREQGLDAREICAQNRTAILALGDVSGLDIGRILARDVVESVTRLQEPYKLASRNYRQADTQICVGGAIFGGNTFQFIAGPCAVESEKQIMDVAVAVKKAGATALRGGVFKPRTSPYAFQGVGKEGLDLLRKAKKETGLPIVTEITDPAYIDDFYDVDVIQVGARNMQNFELLKRLGKLQTPVLLKRGVSATVDEWLMSAEYILAEGNENVILCERGIRTFDAYTRGTLDLSVVPALKERTHLPVIVDPSHAAGIARYVKPLSLASAGVGADGLMIETHIDPQSALCDGAQAIDVAEFAQIVREVKQILPIVGKTAD